MTDTNRPPEQAQTQGYIPKLQRDDIIPSFTLPGADGMPHSPWTYKQREHLVLLFMRSIASNETRGLLRAFAHKYTTFREEYCAILAITPDTVVANLAAQETLNLPYPLLADPKGSVITRYTYRDDAAKTLVPSIVLADRYNALYQQWVAEDEANLPSTEEIVESLQYINKLCTP
ncbi:MAG TPA: redoxin domain-containing protein [Ktedonobacteraceae bacterium]|nr:redoxin domain-containing protein [Ktedonobacteraceae bacterium]